MHNFIYFNDEWNNKEISDNNNLTGINESDVAEKQRYFNFYRGQKT